MSNRELHESIAPAQERQEPYRPPSRESDVFVPINQAGVVGLLVASLIVLLALAFKARWPVGTFALLWAILAVSVTLVVFVWRMVWLQATIMRLERWTGKNLPGGYEGGPPPLWNPSVARQQAHRDATQNTRLDEIEELLTFVRTCATVGTSEAAQGVPPSPLMRRQYCDKRDALMALGIAAWKDDKRHAAGWGLVLTPAQAEPLIRRHILGRE